MSKSEQGKGMNAITWDIPDIPEDPAVIIDILENKRRRFYERHHRHPEYLTIDARLKDRFKLAFDRLPVCTNYSQTRNECLGMKISWADFSTMVLESEEFNPRFLYPFTPEETISLLEIHQDLREFGIDYFKTHNRYLEKGDLKELKKKMLLYGKAIKKLQQTKGVIADLVYAIERQEDKKK